MSVNCNPWYHRCEQFTAIHLGLKTMHSFSEFSQGKFVEWVVAWLLVFLVAVVMLQ